VPSHLSSSVHTCAPGHLSSMPSHLSASAVQETSSDNVSKSAIDCRTSRLPPSTWSSCTDSPSSTSSCPVSCVSSPHLLDFTSVEIPYQEYPPRLRERQYDAVVISTEEDAHIADTFKHVLTEFITLEVCLSHVVVVVEFCAFIALTLLAGRQEEHPACKKLSD